MLDGLMWWGGVECVGLQVRVNEGLRGVFAWALRLRMDMAGLDMRGNDR